MTANRGNVGVSWRYRLNVAFVRALIRTIIAVVITVVSATSVCADDFETWFEKSGGLETPRHRETVDYCKLLADASPWVHYTTFGTTPLGRELPLLIVDGDGAADPDAVDRSNHVVLLVQAGIHAGESDGKDAGLMLIRDIAVRKTLPDLLDHVTLVFIPIFNVDGHERFGPYNRINQNGPKEMGFRTTSQNLNLNRDYLKADAPEMRDWIKLFNRWDPDFFVDCHATDGADYQYVLTYIADIYGNMEDGLTAWTRDVYLATMKTNMATIGYEMFPYVYLMDWPNPRGGIRSWVSTPRFSTGYASLKNRPSLLIETHMLKDYKTRVTGTYEMLRETMHVLSNEHERLRDMVATADDVTASAEFRSNPYPLRFAPDDMPGSIRFNGIEYETETSDVTGGPWYRFNGEPATFDIPYYEKQNVTATAQLPELYVIPPQWTDVIDRLDVHGVQMTRLDEEKTVTVSSYRFSNLDWQVVPFEGRHPATFRLEVIEQERVYPAGSVVIDMNQSDARVIAHVLEPDGPDSYVFWGFFDIVFEQKEYGESYVLETMAREMLADDKSLGEEFEEMKKNTPGFADDQRRMLNWFYERTPYWDQQKDVYPVGKVFDAETARELRGS